MRRQRQQTPPCRLLLLACGALALAACLPTGAAADTADASAHGGDGGTTGKLNCRISSGRSGSYFLPANRGGRALPVAVLLHGAGGSGADMVAAFRELAALHRFAIVAPDSKSPHFWFPKFGSAGEDPAHVSACLNALRALPGWRPDPARLLVAGFGAGGTFAPHYAFATPSVGALAMLHAPWQDGFLRLRGWPHLWYSTGRDDDTVDFVMYNATAAQLQLYCNLPSLTVPPRERYSSGHWLGGKEKREMVEWWLRGAGSAARPPAPPRPPRLAASTASAAALQSRLASNDLHAAYVGRDGVVAATPVASCSSCHTPAFYTRSPAALAAGSGGSLVALSRQGTLEVNAWTGSSCAVLCSRATFQACQRGVAAVAAGPHHTLLLSGTGAVQCLYEDDVANMPPDSLRLCGSMPAGLPPVAAVSAGELHSLALLANGSVVAWGCRGAAPPGSPCRPPGALRPAAAVAAGGGFSMALTINGTVTLWGSAALRSSMPREASAAPPGNPVVAIAAAADSAWALLKNGTLLGWSAVPTRRFAGPAVGVAASGQHTGVVTVRLDGSVWHARALGSARRQVAPPGSVL